jgi:hypothetical protein
MTRKTDDHGTEIRVDLLLDEAARQARLWENAKGRPWRPTFEDVGLIAAMIMMAAVVLWRMDGIPSGLLPVVMVFALAQQWRTQRLQRRIDAMARLLEQDTAKRA